MYYHFKESQFNVTHKELCKYNNYNHHITSHVPSWRKGRGTIFIDGKYLHPIAFLNIFTDIGNIHASRLPPLPEPKRIK